ncbi:MAG: POTRA domain-containing protein, partial [candidate division WOR-3 bacterium]
MSLLLVLLLAQVPTPDTARLVLLSVSATAPTADTGLVVRTAGLPRGEPLTQSALRNELQDALRRVYGLGLFSQVHVETTRVADGVRIHFIVQEFPRLKSIVYEGFRRVRKKDIESRVKAKEGEILTDKKVFDWQSEIQKLYKEKGFLLVKIESEKTLPDSAGQVVLTYRIDEGDPVRIRRIELHGNEHFSDREIEIRLVNREKAWYRKARLKEDEFIKDLDRIVDFYKQRGFIDARVLDYDMKFDQGWTDITIDVAEGTRYYFGTVSFQGDSVFTADQLHKLVRYESGSVYNT